MSPKFIITHKNIGETPLECLERTRLEHEIEKVVPMTYAGRLDPMAEGLMIFLVGEECKKKEGYLRLDKTYEFQILVGFSTDTYDLLGLVSKATAKEIFERSSDLLSIRKLQAGQTISNTSFAYAIEKILPQFTKKFTQKYPPFSSKTIDGKQMFQLSKDDELPDDLPEHEVTIKKLLCTSTTTIEKEELKKEIIKRIDLVHGDFRQKEIIEKWNKAFENTSQKEFEIILLVCECSGGTYIRQLVADIGDMIGIPLLTYSINRVRVGEYNIDDKPSTGV